MLVRIRTRLAPSFAEFRAVFFAFVKPRRYSFPITRALSPARVGLAGAEKLPLCRQGNEKNFLREENSVCSVEETREQETSRKTPATPSIRARSRHSLWQLFRSFAFLPAYSGCRIHLLGVHSF